MGSDSVTSAPPVTGSLAADDVAKPKIAKSNKESKLKKPAAPRKPRSNSSHPPFLVMITEAILALKERTGSSQYAITKFIEENYKQLPGNFRKLLLVHLKRLVASEKLVKVKNSFKLSPALLTVAKAKVPEKRKSEVARNEKQKKTGKVTGVKRKATAVTKSPAKKVKKTVSAAVTGKKKAMPAKSVKKPKSVKSPVKKPKSVNSPVKKLKSVKSPVKKPKSVKSPVRKAKSVKSPAKKPLTATGKKGKK